ncbi:MAG: Maf family protein [Pseudomonadales bacterium]|jgi:septum formation protein
MASLFLASTSPRRRELLQQIGVDFESLAVEVDETHFQGETPADYVRRLALLKARSGLEALSAVTDAVVLGGDTTVVCEGQVFGKPVDRADALRMLGMLSGKTHQVYSAVSLVSRADEAVRLTVTDVTFHALSLRQQQSYWETGEPQGKAGAYAIQGYGAVFVERIQGSYTGVVGLPLAETAELLERFGVAFWARS